MNHTQKCIEIERHLLKLSQYFSAKIRIERIQAYTEDLAIYPLNAILQACARMKSESSKPWPSIADFKSATAGFIEEEELPNCAICENHGVRLFFEKEEIEKFGARSTGEVAFACTCLRGKANYPSLTPVHRMQLGKYVSRESALKQYSPRPQTLNIENKNELRRLNV